MITSLKNNCRLFIGRFLVLAAIFALPACLGCGIQRQSSVEVAPSQTVGERRAEPIELEGAWDMYSATYASIGGSSYTFNGDRVAIVTARAVGDDKINFETVITTESGTFAVEANGEMRVLRISLDDKSSRVMEYTLGGGELHIWPEGNRGFTMSCRKRIR